MWAMFTEDDRNQIRARLLERASEDRRVTSAAVAGSASRGAEDRWSDIDLFFGVAAEIALEEVLGDWSEFMYKELGALHHFDVQSGSAIYRPNNTLTYNTFLRDVRDERARTEVLRAGALMDWGGVRADT